MKINAVPYFITFRRYLLFTTGTLALVLLFSCNTVKKVHKGQYLLSRIKIIYRFGSPQKTKGLATDITGIGKEGIEKFEIPQRIEPSEILPYMRQKPYTRIFFVFPFYLYLYNLPDSVNTAKAKVLRDSAYVIKARKKGWKQEKLNRKIGRKTGREWIMSQGEAPVIFDSALTQKSTEQVKTFLFNKGYFNAQVKDSVHIRGQKAEVYYIIKPGKPYKIHDITYFFEDPALAAEIYADTANCKVRRNEVYDQDVIDGERDRITTELNNAGYFYFSKAYIYFTIDTNSKTHLVDITINIKKFRERDKINKDSTVEINHIQYRIRHVTVQMDYDPAKVSFYHATDSINYEGLTIVYPNGLQCLKPAILRPKIFVFPGDLYRVTNKDDTYTGLAQLNEFSYISVKYAPIKDSNYIDCYIQLMPIVKHSIGAEFEGTNTGGDLGVAGNISYDNYNQFNGAEKLQFKINGGLIAQEVFSGNGGTLLNTEDLGPELDLFIPRPLFPYNTLLQALPLNVTNPQTSLKLTFDYQLRLGDYIRHVLGLSYGLDFTSKSKKSRFTVALFEWNLVNAYLDSDFIKQLDQYNLFFQNSFQNQVITDGRISWTYSTQNNSKKQKKFIYLKTDVEWSGLVFDALKHVLKLPSDSTGSYYIRQFNAPYSQYIKLDADFRQYFPIGRKQTFVYRIFAGYGLPYANSTGLPFTKSFWGGGSNDIRAWQIQTLGPGGTPASTSDIAGQVGETKLEGNVEYRVKLIKYFDFAWFIDAGNIWLIKSVANEDLPLAYMHLDGANSVLQEIAIGTGPGFRFDFDYFVFRIDLGQPVRDPSFSPDNRWIPLHDYSIHRTVLNIGIGYPF